MLKLSLLSVLLVVGVDTLFAVAHGGGVRIRLVTTIPAQTR
jgi:hypothetical protein